LTALSDLRLADLLTLMAVQRTGSISGAAREQRVTPSQVSKAMARLERQYGVRLLSRGARGVAPTSAGRNVLPHIAIAVEELNASIGVREDRTAAIDLTIAGPSYLVAVVLPAAMALLPRAHVRGLEFGPARLRANVAENLFDVALSPGGIENRPAAWSSDAVGTIRMGLFGRPALAKSLGQASALCRSRSTAFVRCPSSAPLRQRGVSASSPRATIVRCRWPTAGSHTKCKTIGAALEFAGRADCVVFGPFIAARRLLEGGVLVEIPVAGWNVREPLYVLCSGDRVLSRVRTAVLQAAQDALDA
jgi:DNA-binding transcriptional LysR family regulator